MNVLLDVFPKGSKFIVAKIEAASPSLGSLHRFDVGFGDHMEEFVLAFLQWAPQESFLHTF